MNTDNMGIAERVKTLRGSGAFQVLARAQSLEATGHHIVHLDIGEPDFNTPAAVSEAGIEAIRAGMTHYSPPAGLSALRGAIAKDAGRRRNLSISLEQVVVSPGTKLLLFLTTLALVNPGDEVIYPDPGFPTYPEMITVAGGVPVPVTLCERDGFSLDLAMFDRSVTGHTRLIVLNSPGNPTGGVIPKGDLQHIAEAAIDKGSWVLSDEIYSRIVFEGVEAPSIASLPDMADRTVIVDGFSKTYAMTGWRLGFGIMPKPLAERIGVLLTDSAGSTATFTQLAGITAVTGSQDPVHNMVAEYQKRRDILVDGLNRLPRIRCQCPQGAFYAFPNISAIGRRSDEVVAKMLEGGVAVLPGTAFGQFGEGYLRLSYATSSDNIRLALERMECVLQGLRA